MILSYISIRKVPRTLRILMNGKPCLIPLYSAEEIRCVFDDNSKIIFVKIFIKTYVVGAH